MNRLVYMHEICMDIYICVHTYAHTYSGIHRTTDRHSVYTRPSIYGLLAQVSNQRWHHLSKRENLLAPQSIWMPTGTQYIAFHTLHNYRHCL